MKVGFEWFVRLFRVVSHETPGVASFCLNHRLGSEEIEKHLTDLVQSKEYTEAEAEVGNTF